MFKIFDITSTGMSAQSLRLNTVASNLANADSVAETAERAYRARMPVFQEMMLGRDGSGTGVAVRDIVESGGDIQMLYQPENPLADDNGYVYRSNVNTIEEMANMTSASQSYRSNVEMLSTVKRLMLATLRLGQSG
jgi:flagellar basal-body rod protein FlgC